MPYGTLGAQVDGPIGPYCVEFGPQLFGPKGPPHWFDHCRPHWPHECGGPMFCAHTCSPPWYQGGPVPCTHCPTLFGTN
jgi:hypothetical protein